MEFEQHVQIEIPAKLGGTISHKYSAFHLDKELLRINPLCKCTTYTVGKEYFATNPPKYTGVSLIQFTIKVKSFSRKIVVLTYEDGIQQFLEFNIIPHDTK